MPYGDEIASGKFALPERLLTGLRIDSGRLLIKTVAKIWGHAIAQQLLHSPYVVRQTCGHSRRNRLPLLGGAGASGRLGLR